MKVIMAPVTALALLCAMSTLAAPLSFAPGSAGPDASPRGDVTLADLHRSLKSNEDHEASSVSRRLQTGDSNDLPTVVSVREDKYLWGDVEMQSPEDSITKILTEKDRRRRAVYATPADGKARQLATVNEYLRVTVPQGFIARVDCPDGSAIATLNFTEFGLLSLNRSMPGPATHRGRIVTQLVPTAVLIPLTPCVCSAVQDVYTAGGVKAIPRSQRCTERGFPFKLCEITVPGQDVALYPAAPSVITRQCLGREKCDVDAETGAFLSAGAPLPLWDQLEYTDAETNETQIIEMYENKVLAIEAQCRPFCRVPAPSTPFADVRTTLRDVYNRSAGAFATYQCRVGYAQVGGTLGVVSQTACNGVGEAWPPAPITCTPCGVGFFCPGDGRRYPCANGTFSNSATDTTAMCSGYCEPGFRCLQPGARSATSDPCGGTGEFICPRNETLEWRYGCEEGRGFQQCDKRPMTPTVRIAVPANAYSLPLSAPASQRYFWLPCPSNRQCAGGLLLPHFRWKPSPWRWHTPQCFSSDGVSGRADITIDEGRSGAESSLSVEVETPGFPSEEWVNWTIVDNVWTPESRFFPLDYRNEYRSQRRWQRCPVSSLEMTNRGSNMRSAGMRTRPGVPPLTWEQCGRRFPVVIRALRPNNPFVTVECIVHIIVRRALAAPTIANCDEGAANARRVEEAIAPGSPVGAPLQGSQVGGMQPGVVMRYFLPDWRDRNDFAVDTCSGQIFTSDILNRSTTPDQADLRRIRVEVIADGAALGMGSASTFCTAIVNVTRRNSPPVIFTSSLTIPELRPAGSLVGTVRFADPDAEDAARVVLGLADRLALLAMGYTGSSASGDEPRDPGAFSIDARTGEVRTTREINALNTGVYNYYLMLNASDGRAWTASPLTIVITPVPRPPVVPSQSVSIMEFTSDGSLPVADPPLFYTHPLNDNVTWWISPNTTFTVQRTGSGRHVLVLAPGVALDYYALLVSLQPRQSLLFLTAFARDSQGNVASGQVTVNIMEANREPFWVNNSAGVFNATLRDWTPLGSALPARLVAADSNREDRLLYRLTGSVPPQAASVFSIDALTGLIRLNTNPACPACAYMYNRSWSWPGGDPYTIVLSVEVRDNGVPSRWITGHMRVAVVDIRPQVTGVVVSLSAAAVDGTVVGSPSVWLAPRTPAGMSPLSFSFPSTNTPRAPEPFAINATTGVIRVANSSAFDWNAIRSYSVDVQVSYSLPLPDGTAVSTGNATLNTTGLSPEQRAAALAAFQEARTRIPVVSNSFVGVTLIHVNRAPRWNMTGIRVFTPFRYAGRIGPALRAFVSDPDLGITFPPASCPTCPMPILRREQLAFRIVSGNTADSALAINASDGQLSVVRPGSAALVFVTGQAAPVVTLTVEVCDGGVSAFSAGTPLCSQSTVPVEVLEGNLPPTVNATVLTVAENSPVGTPVGQPLRASDPDPGQVLRFTIVDADVEGAFHINNITGQISSAVALDFESRSRYVLLVQVTDNGRVPLSATAEVVINVRDVNEAPSFTSIGPFRVPENSPMRTTVGYVNASDPDAADASRLRFSLIRASLSQGVEVADSKAQVYWAWFWGLYLSVNITYQESLAPFAIDAVTGEIWLTTNALNMEARATYVVSVRVTDSAGLMQDRQVTVSVSNVNDRPAADDVLLYMIESVSAWNILQIPVTDDDYRQEHFFLPGPHYGSHYCTGWQNRRQLEVNWDNNYAQYEYLWPHTSGAHIDLSLVPAGQPLTIDFRMGGAGAGKVILGGSEYGTWCSEQECADRYEVEVDGRTGGLTLTRMVATLQSNTYSWQECLVYNVTLGRCTSTGMRTYTYVFYRSEPVTLFTGTFTSLLSSPDGSMSNYYLRLRRVAGAGGAWRTLEVGTRSSNELSATYTRLANVTDSQPTLAYLSSPAGGGRLYVTTVGTSPSRRISSVCYSASPFLSEWGNMHVDYSVGSVSVWGLDYETRRYVGQEFEITDMPAGSALAPSYLSTYSVVEAVAYDVNEPPTWNVSAMVTCPNATLSRVLACVTVPEGTPAGTVIATIPRAVDPDRFWVHTWNQNTNAGSSRRQVDAAVDYSFRLDNVPRSARVLDFSNSTDTLRYEALYSFDSWYGEWAWGLNHSSRDVVVVNPELLDFESTQGAPQEFRVWASDVGGWSMFGSSRLSTAPALVVVRVTDVNERPSLNPRLGVWTVEEMSLEGTLVGTPGDWNARDPDTPGTAFARLTFSATGGTGRGVFGVHPVTGQVFVAPGAVIDFERLNNYTLTVTVTDGGSPALSFASTILIRVIDINEAPVLSLPSTYDVPESAASLLFGSPLSVRDPDAGSFFTWAVVGGTGMSLFDVNCDGKLVVRPGVSLDYEQQTAPTYTLTIRVMDNGSPGLYAENSTTIRITDVNEAPSIAIGQRYTVLEAAPNGTVLGTIQWSDPDVFASNSAWRTPTFSLASEGNFQGLLEVHRTTGVLRVGSRPLVGLVDPSDDADRTLTLFVDVTDGGGLRARAPFEVKVIGINYPPTWLAPGPATGSGGTGGGAAQWVLRVDENTPGSPQLPGDKVGRPVPATDRNAKHVPTLAFSVTSVWPTSGRSFFDVQSSTEGDGQAQVVLAGTAALDYEAVASYTVELQVIDVYNATSRVNVTVQANDRNEAPSVAYPGVVEVGEDMQAGVDFGAAPTVTDPEGDSLSFRATGGNGTVAFGVNPTTGRLFVLPGVSLDYEAAAWYTLEVQATDSGSPDGTAAALGVTVTVSISVMDVNEAPTWPEGSLVSLSVVENSAPGTALTTSGSTAVLNTATDVDAEDALTYSINAAAWTAANGPTYPANLVAVSASGAVTVGAGAGTAGLLDYEGQRVFNLPVTARDRAGLSATQIFTVTVLNANEAPVWTNLASWTRVFVRLSSGNVIGRPLSEYATDVDMSGPGSAERLAYSIASITATQSAAGGGTPTAVAADLTPFVSIASSTGQLSLGDVASFPSFSQAGATVVVTVTVTVSDAAGASASNPFVFTTTDNNNPPVCTAQRFSLAEGSPAGFVVGTLTATDPDPGTPTFAWSLSQTAGAVGEPMLFSVAPATGVITVTSSGAGVLDFETLVAASTEGAPTFALQATVTDGNPNFPLFAQCAVTITLLDVNEPPRLRPVSLGSTPAAFALALPENSLPGTRLQLLGAEAGTVTFPAVLGVAAAAPGAGPEGRSLHLTAIDEDAADAGPGSLTFSLLLPPTVPAGLFTVNASTGVITVSSAASPAALARLDFESALGATLVFTAVVTDRAGATDSAVVTVRLQDMNDAAVFGRLLLNGTGTPVDVVSVSETLAPGSAIVRVTASDVDAGAAGVLRFGLVASSESTPFRIDPVSGLITLGALTALDWESKALYTPTVTVTDQSGAPLTVTQTVTVRVLDVFDANVASVTCATSGSPANPAGSCISGTAVPATHPLHSVLVRTEGGVRLRFSGTNLGLSTGRLAAEGLTAQRATEIDATYGPTTGAEYRATGCRITSNGREFECTTTASAGRDFIWNFRIGTGVAGAVNGSFTFTTRRTGTQPPVITSVLLAADADGNVTAPVQRLSTTGGNFLSVRGANLGPLGTTVSLTYSTGQAAAGAVLYTSTVCAVRTAHTLMVCRSVPGVGRNLVFQASSTTAPNHTSTRFVSGTSPTPLSYDPPRIQSILAPALATVGGDTFQVLGSSFGPASAVPGAVALSYAAPEVWRLSESARAQRGVADLLFAATGCTINNDTLLTCTSAAGVGAGLVPVVTIAEQSSNPAVPGTPTLGYRQPNITALGGSGIDRVPTTGGTTLRLTGTDFGPQFNASADRLAALNASGLGAAFYPLPSVRMGQLYLQPTAPVRPLGYTPGDGAPCQQSELGSRCMPSQCGSTRAVCDGEVWALQSAPFGQVCLEAENTVSGRVEAAFIPSGDDRCSLVGEMTYELADCAVTTPHTGITCTVPPGVGKWLYVSVASIGRQAGMAPVPSISYAPPVITEFSGEGASGASTAGSQSVTIRGMNFGDRPSELRAVTYGADSREFAGVSCALTVPHTEIVCTTSPGAGARLAWTVRINNQDSVTPLTDYAAPSIDSITGVGDAPNGAVDAPTLGNSTVILTGRNFATTAFLDFVTYGPTGREYTAAGCRVTVAHSEITCKTVPGTGRYLLWRVSVRGQVSRLSITSTSYAAPYAAMLSTMTGKTSGVEGVLLYGWDLGVSVPGAVMEVHMERYGSSGVSLRKEHKAEWEAWTQALLEGDAVAADGLKTDNITAWLAAAVNLPVYSIVQLPGGEEALLFDIPDGCGTERELVVFVEGVPSNVLTFSYSKAVVRNVAPVRDLNGNLRLVVEGDNFCGRALPIRTPAVIDKNPIALEAKPNKTEGINSVIVPAQVNSAASDREDVDAAILSQAADEEEEAAEGGEDAFSMDFTLLRRRRLSSARSLEAVELDASSAVARGMRRLQAAGGAPSSSSSSSGSGDAMCISVNGTCVPSAVATTSRFEARIPEPAGLGAGVSLAISMQTPQGEAPGKTFDAPSPYFDDAQAYTVRSTTTTAAGARQLQAGGRANLDGMDTAGGQRVFFPNVTSLQTVSAADVVVTVGGRRCTDVVLSEGRGTVPTNYVWTVSCLTPPGIGRNLTMSVCSLATTGGCSPSFDNRAFSYSAPTVSDVLDGPASVLVSAPGGVSIPTTGKTLLIRGKGFGERAALGPDFTAKVTVTLSTPSATPGGPSLATTLDAPVIGQTDTQLQVAFPEGYGSVASVLVQTQRTAGAITGESYVQDAPTVSVCYAAPAVSQVTSTGTATVGGAVLTVTGSGFGAPSSGLPPAVTVGGRPCPVLTYSHGALTCTLPAGQGAAVPVAVSLADQTSAPAAAARFAYAPPALVAVNPLNSRTDGLYPDGTPVELTLRGSNFGPAPVVELRPVSPSALASGMRVVIVPSSAIRRLDPGHDLLVVPVPEGAGRELRVVLVAGDQASAQTSFLFNYDQPRIARVTRLGRTEDACRPRTEAVPRVRDGTFVNRTSRPDCFPTLGGYLLSVQGSSMGPADIPLSVSINGTACAVQYHSHTETVCRIPAGMGTALPVSLSAGGQVSAPSPLVTFSYDPPVVLNVMPNIPFAVGGERLIIYGYNFGIAATRVDIRIGGLECSEPVWVNDSQVTCVAPRSTVGPKSLSIDIANRNAPFVYSAEEEVVIYQCKTGWYGTAGEMCVNCALQEPGADCPGGELYYDLVTAQPGWYRVNVSRTASARDRKELCHPLREAGRPECPAFLPCTPTGACLGANRCAAGYTGTRCGSCSEGFYKLNDQCVSCPDRTSALVIAFIVFCLAAVAATYLMVTKGSTWTMLMVCLDYAQILALMNRFSIKWPAPAVTRWLVAASASFLNLELIAPECSIQSTTFVGKWAAVEILPLLITGMLLLAYAVKRAYIAWAAPQDYRGGAHHAFLGTGMLLFRLLYVYIARNSLDVFNCAPLSQGDTKTEYLSSNLDIPCYQGVHWQMVGAGIAGIIVYLVLVPMYIGWRLYKGSKGVIFMDQLARARGATPPVTEEDLGHTEPTHPDASFRRVWHSFYAPYKPNNWYWEGVIAARKFMIIFTSLLYNRTTTFQQALCLLALFVTAAVHVRVRPYFTADTATRLLVKYEPKVQIKATEEAQKAKANFQAAQARRHELEHKRASVRSGLGAVGSSGRASLAALSTAPTKAADTATDENSEAKQLNVAMDRIKYLRAVHSLAAVKTRKAQMQRRVVMGYPVLSLFLDYNQVETVLVASLILQSLAGVMFGSSLFAGANLERFFADQYDAMAGATVTLLAVTAIYMILCLFLDYALEWNPDAVQDYAEAYLGWNARLEDVMADKASLFGTSTRVLTQATLVNKKKAGMAGIAMGGAPGQHAQAHSAAATGAAAPTFATVNPMLAPMPATGKSARSLVPLPYKLVSHASEMWDDDVEDMDGGAAGLEDEESGPLAQPTKPMAFAPLHSHATGATGGSSSSTAHPGPAALLHSLVTASQQVSTDGKASPTLTPAAAAAVGAGGEEEGLEPAVGPVDTTHLPAPRAALGAVLGPSPVSPTHAEGSGGARRKSGVDVPVPLGLVASRAQTFGASKAKDISKH